MNEMVVDHKGAAHVSKAQTATRTDHSHVTSPPTASDTKNDMVSVAVDFIDEYADTFDMLSNRKAHPNR